MEILKIVLVFILLVLGAIFCARWALFYKAHLNTLSLDEIRKNMHSSNKGESSKPKDDDHESAEEDEVADDDKVEEEKEKED